jgi:hypothetical protein
MMKAIFSCFVLLLVLTAVDRAAFAQRETATGVTVEKDLALLRRDIRAEKKKLIAASLPLTETEATKFWPLYDQYVAEMTRHNDEFYSLIKEYAENQKTITDAQATSMIHRWAEIQIGQAQTRQKYIPLVEKVLSGKKVALFFQIDRRLYVLLDVQVSWEAPLIVQ